MEQSTNTYTYSPLDPSKQEIRLVNLLPASSISAPIFCEIQHTYLSWNPNYEALSYAWGDAKVTSDVFLDDRLFSITTNLESALRHLRRSDRFRTFWIDAICIDQQNFVERGEQVTMMGLIYESASHDILWMGEDVGLHEDVARLMKTSFASQEELRMWSGRLLGQNVTRLETLLQDAERCEPFTKELTKIYEKPTVWDRVWVLQELALAKEVKVVYGFHMFHWSTMTLLHRLHRMTVTFDYISSHKASLKRSSQLGACSILEARLHPPRTRSLLTLWSTHGYLGATDTRDRIFALLSLANNNLGIKPDYLKDRCALLLEVARATIVRGGDLELLMLGYVVGTKENAAFLESLPSWVPKRKEELCGSVLLWDRFSAGMTTPSRLALGPVERFEDPKILDLRGIYLDTVKNIRSLEPTTDWTVEAHFGNISRLKNATSQGTKYFNGESLIEAYCRTMLSAIQYLTAEDYKQLVGFFSKPLTKMSNQDEEAIMFLKRIYIYRFTWQALLGITPSAYFSLLPLTVKVDDVICVLYGCRAPMVLRRTNGSDCYKVIGPAYVHGFMSGEAIGMLGKGQLHERRFRLI